MNLIHTKILHNFEQERLLYGTFANSISTLIERILSTSGIAVHSVTWRCKERESLAKKLMKTTSAYRSLGDITDIAAIRITTYFSEDVDRVAQIVKSEFNIDELNSIDKRTILDPDRFGYQSLHYVVAMSDLRLNLIENHRFKTLKAEVQIRSILQHAWAEIEHDLGYKSSSGIPREIRRKFARIAGLLELADDEFGAIRAQLLEYSKTVVSEIQDNPAEVEINLPSLRALYKINSNLRNLDPIVANIMQRTLIEDPNAVRETYVERLASFGIIHINELEEIALKEREVVAKFAKYWLSRPKDDVLDEDDESRYKIGSSVGLFYLLYVLAFRTGSRKRIEHYLNANNIGHGDQDLMADQILLFNPN